MNEKIKLQDMSMILDINKQIAKLEYEIQKLRNEENQIWKRNNNKFEIDNS